MKKSLLILVLVLASITIYSQISISTTVNPPYSPYYEDYLQYDNKVVIVLQNTSNQDYEFYLYGSITSDIGIEITTKSSFRPSEPYTIAAHQTIQLSGGDLDSYLSLDNVDLVGIEENDILGSEGLPEGNYQICIQALDWTGDNPLSGEYPLGCSANIYIQHIEPSTIINPICGTEVIATDPQNITFSWSISPGALPNTEYLLQITEVFDGQDPESAFEFMIAPPFFERQVKGYAYTYADSDNELIPGTQYAVRVRSIDPYGKKVYRNDGFGEACSFLYKTEEEPQDTIPDDDQVAISVLSRVNNCTVSGRMFCKMPRDNKTAYHTMSNANGNLSNGSAMISSSGMSFSDFNFASTSSLNNSSIGAINVINGATNAINSLDLSGLLYNGFTPKKYYEMNKETKDGAIPLTNTTIKLVPRLALLNAEADDGKKSTFVLLDVSPSNQLYSTTYQEKIDVDISSIPTIYFNTDGSGNFSKTFHLSREPGLIEENVKYAITHLEIHSYDTGIDKSVSFERITGDLAFVYSLEVVDDRFLSPKTIVLPKIFDHVELPDQVSLIKAFGVRISVKPQIDQLSLEGMPIFSMNGVIPNAEINLFRTKDSYNTEKKEIIKLEGQQLKEWRTINGKLVKLVSTTKTDGKGNAQIDFLVNNRNSSYTDDDYYIEIITRNPSQIKNGYEPNKIYNYEQLLGSLHSSDKISSGKLLNKDEYDEEYETSQRWNDNYTIPIRGLNYYLTPLPPEIKGRVREKSNSTTINPVKIGGLVGAKVSLYNHLGFIFSSLEKGYTTGTTGWFRFTRLRVDHEDNIATGPKRFLTVYKKGYNLVFRPEHSTIVLSWGQFWNIGNIDLYPDAKVSGYVEDESGIGVESYVNIVDGAYYKTKWASRKSLGSPFYHGTQKFKMFAPTGYQFFTASPLSSQYFPGYLIKDVPSADPTMIDVGSEYKDVGVITVYKKLHRLRVIVKDPSGKKLNARVELGDTSTVTQGGYAFFKFPSQAEDFTLSIIPNDKEYMEYHEVIHLPNSSTESAKYVTMYKGYTLKGQVIDKTSKQAIQGAIVKVYLGNYNGVDKTISTTTDARGNYTLKGIPTDDQSSWNAIEIFKQTKPSDSFSYLLAKEFIDFGYYSEPPFTTTELERTSKINDIWGFPVAISGATVSGTDRLKISGYFHHLPTAEGVQLQDKDQQLYFSNLELVKNAAGKYEPSEANITLFTNHIKIKINDAFICTFYMAKNHGRIPKLVMHKKDNSNAAYIDGLCLVEAESFKSSYDYKGGDIHISNHIKYVKAFESFSDGHHPASTTNLKFDVFQFKWNLQWRHYATSDIKDFRIFGFPAIAKQSESYLRGKKIHLSANVQTSIKNCKPANLNFKLGEIVITSTTADFVKGQQANNFTFKLDNWDVVNQKGWTFDKNEEAFILEEVLVNTHTGLDFRVKGMRVKYDELTEGEVSDNGGLTLGGVVDLHINKGANITFFYDEGSGINGQYIITGTSTSSNIAAYTDALPGMTGAEKRLVFDNFTFGSKETDPALSISMQTTYQNIMDFTVMNVQTTPGVLDIVGQPDFHIPNLQIASLIIRYTKSANVVTHQIVPINARADTYGGVKMVFDPREGSQNISYGLFTTYVDLTLNQHSGSESSGDPIALRGLLIKKPNSCRVKIINLDVDGFEDKDGKKQVFPTGDPAKSLVIYSGSQVVNSNMWEPLKMKAHSDNSKGMKGKPNIFDFTVYGAIDVQNNKANIDNIDIGLGKLSMTYDWSSQSIHGSLYMRSNVPCGPVTLLSGGTGFCQFGGGGFYIGYSGSLTVSGFNVTNASMLLGWHDKVLRDDEDLVIGYFTPEIKNKILIPKVGIHGIFIGAKKVFFNKDMFLLIPTVFMSADIGMEAFFEAKFSSPIEIAVAGNVYAKGSVRVDPPGIPAKCIFGASANVSIEGRYKDGGMDINSKGTMKITALDQSVSGCLSLHLGTDDPMFDVDLGFGDGCGDDSSSTSNCP